tara:strand:+ start:268 stop:513 length:246 start_codon:yes stop_codon:yes gene_type:complete
MSDTLLMIVIAICLHYVQEHFEKKNIERSLCPTYCEVDHPHNFNGGASSYEYEECSKTSKDSLDVDAHSAANKLLIPELAH